MKYTTGWCSRTKRRSFHQKRKNDERLNLIDLNIFKESTLIIVLLANAVPSHSISTWLFGSFPPYFFGLVHFSSTNHWYARSGS